jgi:hypothetical protein
MGIISYRDTIFCNIAYRNKHKMPEMKADIDNKKEDVCKKVFSFYSIMIYLLFSLWMSSWTIVHYPVRGHPFVQKDSKINLSFLGPIHIVYWCFLEFRFLYFDFYVENVDCLYYLSHFQMKIWFAKCIFTFRHHQWQYWILKKRLHWDV